MILFRHGRHRFEQNGAVFPSGDGKSGEKIRHPLKKEEFFRQNY